MPNKILLGAIVLAFAVAGCTNNPELEPGTNSDQGEPSANAFKGMELKSCHASATSLESPRERISPSLPDGWEYGAASIPRIQLQFFQCERVAVGPHEQENVNILIESIGVPFPPERCSQTTGIGSIAFLVSGIWMDNDPVLRWFNENKSIPLQYFSIIQSNETGPFAEYELEWNINGEKNHLTFTGTGDSRETSFEHRWPFFWPTPMGFHAFIFENENIKQENGIVSASGLVSSPHNNPHPTEPDWIGGADSRFSNHSVDLFSFEDSKCTEKS